MIHRLLLEEALRRSSALLELSQVDSIADAVMELVESGMLARTQAISPALCRTGHNADATRNKFLVKFEDPDVPDQAFDDEVDARVFFQAASENWNCYLFQLMERRTGGAGRSVLQEPAIQ